jgi:hypothetical protein
VKMEVQLCRMMIWQWGQCSRSPFAGDRREILNLLPHAIPVSLNLPENFSFEEWREIGHKLGRAERTLQWWIADWWVHGEHQYGERIQQVENFGYLPLKRPFCSTCGAAGVHHLHGANLYWQPMAARWYVPGQIFEMVKRPK